MTFETSVIQASIDKLFNRSRVFSICDLEQIGELIGVNVQQHPDYKFLRALHCVAWADMSPAVRAELPLRCMQVLRPIVGLDAARFAYALTAEGRDFESTEDRYLPAFLARPMAGGA